MKMFVMLTLGGMLLTAQTATQNKGKAATTTTKQAAGITKPAEPLTVPKGAVQVSTYMWKYTDPQGKKWVYRQTAFGLQKAPEAPPEEQMPDYKAPVKVTDLGDSVQFERSNGFGTQRWTKKKAELSGEEKQMWDESKKVRAAQ